MKFSTNCFSQVVDMPLLFETGSHKFTHPCVLVAADPDHQVRCLGCVSV